MTTRFHVGTAKRFLLMMVDAEGPKWLQDFEGTKEEALEAILNDPRDTFVPEECDNQAPDGRCLGHPVVKD